ncbi:MAG TPA: hypothetical protein VF070_03415 [Streptosporangiaceae bacterium]
MFRICSAPLTRRPSLSDEQDLAEITSPDFPGERLIACRNPLLTAERARERDDLLTATETLLGKVKAKVATERITGRDTISVRVGRVVNKYKIARRPVRLLRVRLTARPVEPDRAAQGARHVAGEIRPSARWQRSSRFPSRSLIAPADGGTARACRINLRGLFVLAVFVKPDTYPVGESPIRCSMRLPGSQSCPART